MREQRKLKKRIWIPVLTSVVAITIALLVMSPLMKNGDINEQGNESMSTDYTTNQSANHTACSEKGVDGEYAEEGNMMIKLNRIKLNSTTDINVSDSVTVWKSTPVELTSDELIQVEDNLSNSGWRGTITFSDAAESNSDLQGLYFISSDMEGEIFDSATDDHHETAVRFLNDSCIVELFEQKGVYFKLDESNPNCIPAFCYSYVNDAKVNGYIRMSFEKEMIIGEIKIYALTYEEETTLLPISIEDVIDIGEYIMPLSEVSNDYYKNYEFELESVNIIDYNGIPMYELMLTKKGTKSCVYLYALAISYDDVKSKQYLLQEYTKIVETGIVK